MSIEGIRKGTKGVPFLSKMVCKRIKGGGGLAERLVDPASYLVSAPLAHWAIITSRSEKLCDFCCLLLSHFILFAFYRVQLECFHFPCIEVLTSVHSCGYFSRETSRGSVRPIKTFLHDRFFPCTLVRGNLSNFVKNLQTSSCFYRSDNHGLTQSSHEVFNYVAVTKS